MTFCIDCKWHHDTLLRPDEIGEVHRHALHTCRCPKNYKTNPKIEFDKVTGFEIQDRGEIIRWCNDSRKTPEDINEEYKFVIEHGRMEPITETCGPHAEWFLPKKFEEVESVLTKETE